MRVVEAVCSTVARTTFLTQIADAVYCAAEQDLIHRHVKPGQYRGGQGQVTLSDVGIARVAYERKLAAAGLAWVPGVHDYRADRRS